MNTSDTKNKLNKHIPLLDLKLQYKSIKSEIDSAIQKVVEDQNFIMGEDVRLLENEIASYSGVKYGIGVSSGTDALILALRAIGIKEGDEVITTPFTFMATAGAISNVGATPVFVDITPDTYNIDFKKIEAKITKNTKAIIPVHLYGQCADMDEILKIANKHNLRVIEDSAQSIGATYKGRPSSSMGDMGCISFFPSKNLGAFGDGGMVVTDNAELADKVKVLRVHGSKIRYIHSIIGTNARLDNLQAAVLRVKLRHLDAWAKKRTENAGIYNELFKNVNGVKTPYVPGYNTHVYHQYVISVDPKKRDIILKKLEENNVESRVYYPIPLHLQECYKFLGYKEGDFPNSEFASRSTLALPVYPELTKEDISFITGLIAEFLSRS